MSLTPLQMAQPARKTPHSKRGKLRAAVLIGVHLLAAIHIAHYHFTGSSATPVEPSEAMQTLELGIVNAGFIFFLLTIVSTAIFGRFFCGWACHIVALQDLCTWMLKKVGWKPKPFRSRLLVFVPLFAALYMFVWPQFLRMFEGRPFPPIVYHLQTDDFWRTFPSLGITLLTFFVCGFLIVVWLGNKGFCTYGCPYGAAYYYADRFSRGRIRVTDACNSCGHCTAVCTSNVRVHEEVKNHKMVVDSGCLKCFDCVDACPSGALYFGYGNSAVRLQPKRIYDYTWPEEIAMALFFLGSLYAYRGLYDQIPFLLALGLSSITAYLLITGVKVLKSPSAKLQRIQLKREGKILPAGVIYALALLGLIGFIGHSSVVQYHTHQANGALAQVEKIVTGHGPNSTEKKPEEIAKASLASFETAAKIGFFPVAENEHKMASLARFLGREQEAKDHLVRAVKLDPFHIAAHRELATYYAGRNQWNEVLPVAKQWVFLRPKDEIAQGMLTAAMLGTGSTEDARIRIESNPEQAVLLAPSFLGSPTNEGQTSTKMLVDALLKLPLQTPQIEDLLARSLVGNNRNQELWDRYQGALDSPFISAAVLKAGISLKKYPEVISMGSQLLQKFPNERALITPWCQALIATDSHEPILKSAEQQPAEVVGAKLVQIVFYELLEREVDAKKVRENLTKLNPGTFETW